MKPVDRRDFLRALGVVGGLLAVGPKAIASVTRGLQPMTASRKSKLPASNGLTFVRTDLHNHSLVSGDAFGEPYGALAAIRGGGIDVACMTEHAIMGKGHGELTCPGWHEGGCDKVEGINDTDWEAMSGIADAAYAPGSFVSFRGFEYSTPTVGHLNVWFSSLFTDPLHERAIITPRAISQIDQLDPSFGPIADLFDNAPDIATIKPFYDWLASDPSRFLFGGGNDAVASFNHPNDFGDFEAWTYHGGAAEHVTMFEAFNTNRYEQPDFFWYGIERGMQNPFNACLNAGWRVGFTGVSDEHSGNYRKPEMASGGLYADSITREGVRAALKARRAFATLESGLRLDATANGSPMGSVISHSSGPIAFTLDIDRGPEWAGKTLWVEVVRPGAGAPTLAHLTSLRVPRSHQPPVKFTVDINRTDGDWVFLRIIDPDRPKHPNAQAPFEQHGGAVAYASPWFLG